MIGAPLTMEGVFVILIFAYRSEGGVSERFKEPVLKTGDPQRAVGSNPTPSASEDNRRDGREVEGGRLLSD